MRSILLTECNVQDPGKNMSYPYLGLERHKGYWNLRACEEGKQAFLQEDFTRDVDRALPSLLVERPGKVFKGRVHAHAEHLAAEASSKVWSINMIDGSTEELCMTWTGGKSSK